ncbi:inorganic phosphate transporter [Streptomyces sp. WAC06614]|uniref:inorganic phosphate transporter n=1 Tax=Streptomyces sp. WAC06614 TaxID=2487416 RepID=UPI000F7A9963|nr:inorganic phosphate transporter [Streptomyces sp. WAC06614]RSS83585.1 inorganic phosphate transporter [Streptomyces sp. WAC06614]
MGIPTDLVIVVGAVLVVALLFDVTNGFHDAANAVATTITTGALGPRAAVVLSAVCNLIGATLSVTIAQTLSGGLLRASDGVRPDVVLAALAGAIVWNLLTWWRGIPSSSTHALVGGLVGATVTSVGPHGVNAGAVLATVLVPMALSPFVAGAAAWVATRITVRAAARTTERSRARGYRAGQIASAGMLSLAHGTNDAQKTMGVITLTLVTAHLLPAGSAPPLWVVAASATAMAVGTYCGGWRIIRTLGRGVTEVRPEQGFAAQTASAAVVLASSRLGFPLSTTHVVTGAVAGTGAGRTGAGVQWRRLAVMSCFWLLTLPATAVIASAAELLTARGLGGEVLTLAVLAGSAVTVRRLARRDAVTAATVTADP